MEAAVPRVQPRECPSGRRVARGAGLAAPCGDRGRGGDAVVRTGVLRQDSRGERDSATDKTGPQPPRPRGRPHHRGSQAAALGPASPRGVGSPRTVGHSTRHRCAQLSQHRRQPPAGAATGTTSQRLTALVYTAAPVHTGLVTTLPRPVCGGLRVCALGEPVAHSAGPRSRAEASGVSVRGWPPKAVGVQVSLSEVNTAG